jgi:hypothetical protein
LHSHDCGSWRFPAEKGLRSRGPTTLACTCVFLRAQNHNPVCICSGVKSKQTKQNNLPGVRQGTLCDSFREPADPGLQRLSSCQDALELLSDVRREFLNAIKMYTVCFDKKEII